MTAESARDSIIAQRDGIIGELRARQARLDELENRLSDELRESSPSEDGSPEGLQQRNVDELKRQLDERGRRLDDRQKRLDEWESELTHAESELEDSRLR